MGSFTVGGAHVYAMIPVVNGSTPPAISRTGEYPRPFPHSSECPHLNFQKKKKKPRIYKTTKRTQTNKQTNKDT